MHLVIGKIINCKQRLFQNLFRSFLSFKLAAIFNSSAFLIRKFYRNLNVSCCNFCNYLWIGFCWIGFFCLFSMTNLSRFLISIIKLILSIDLNDSLNQLSTVHITAIILNISNIYKLYHLINRSHINQKTYF